MTLIQDILLALLLFFCGGFIWWCVAYGRRLDRANDTYERETRRLLEALEECYDRPRIDCIATGGRDHWEVSEARVRHP